MCRLGWPIEDWGQVHAEYGSHIRARKGRKSYFNLVGRSIRFGSRAVNSQAWANNRSGT